MKRILCLLALTVSVGAACNDEITGLGPPSDPATETFDPSLNINLSEWTKLPSGVYIQDLVVGTGDSVTARSDTVWVTYTGYLKTGKSFDSGTNSRFEPASLVVGFREGLQGMRVGGRRRMVIPSALGYGEQSIRNPGTVTPVIPRQSTLIFHVELLRVHNRPDQS